MPFPCAGVKFCSRPAGGSAPKPLLSTWAVQPRRCAIRSTPSTRKDGIASSKRTASRKRRKHRRAQAKCEALRALLHQSPRTFGKPSSVWSLALAAQVCQEVGLTVNQVSIETIRQALKRLGVG